MSRVFVVVSGIPGSGKTTLARPLAAALGLPLIAKDAIKEALFEDLGIGDVEWSKRLGRASIRTVYALAADAGRAVLESSWNPEWSPPELRALGAPLIEVRCECPPEVAVARRRARLGLRHPGHHDHGRDLGASKRELPPLGIGPVVAVDTAAAVDVAAVAAQVRAQPGWPGRDTPTLHNVTLYVDPAQLAEVRAFYVERLGLRPVFEEPGHICCLDVTGDPVAMAVCIHEAEPGRHAGAVELFFRRPGPGEARLADPAGNAVRLHP